MLEVFAGSARLSQCRALTGLKVGTPIDIRNGFDIMTSKGRQMVLDIIREQQPDVVWLAPVCGPWSIVQNINDPKIVAEKRARYLPMIDFVASIARYQQSKGLYFIIENPQKSKIRTLKSIMDLMKHAQVTWNNLDLCAFGLRDPDTKLRSLKLTSLTHNLPKEVMRPIFRRCSNYLNKEKHLHQPLEGNTKSQGSHTKLAQTYPFSFCQEMPHILLRFLKAKPLDNEVFLLEDMFEPFSDSDISYIRSDLDKIDEEYNMTSTSTRVKNQDPPFNNKVDPLYIQDSEVTKLQKAMKQFPQGTELDLESSNKSDSRILAIHNGARRLRYLCIPHTPYNKCIMYNRTIGVNSPLTTPPDDACVFLWQVNSPEKLWILPAHRCDWNEFNPTQWHVLVFSQNRMSFKEAPTIRPMPIDQQGDHNGGDDGGGSSELHGGSHQAEYFHLVLVLSEVVYVVCHLLPDRGGGSH